ncbi:MAG TPA: MarR family transcriptional regulator [Pseudonocardiaceae bacterium]|jgi:DNA-binding MarR family transcriptional regulator|nr:MarR family transcriptional regulator [Pseudonocardiaceae bacterium]
MESQSPWLAADEARAWMGYRRMKGLLDLQVARDLAADAKLSDADYCVLSTLGERPEEDWRLRPLAEALLWSPSRLAHHLTRMEQRGLITRETHTEDGRGASISLSANGSTAIEAAAPAHVRSVRRHFLDLLSPEQLRAFSEITDTVLAHLAGLPANTD